MTADPRRTSSLLPAGGAVEDQILKELNGIISRDDSYRMMLNAMLGIDFIEGLKFTASLVWIITKITVMFLNLLI